jgi:class 3 adenylate cyclase/tetratricopeptide (TPR) repeat protein
LKCPKCQFENREKSKFCIECGHELEINCPKCNNLNPPGSKFCEECGHKLSLPSEAPPKDLSFDEKLTKIQRYLPKGLTEKILSQKDRIEGERKQVTVMFADMEGFTSLSEKHGPEDAYTIMDQIYEILIHKVHDYEGTVNEMTGDGIMALFGAPIALEDAPQRAIRSAYAIHREIARFNDRMKQEKEGLPQLKMRIGIHTGPVVVGTLGNDLRVEFKAVGDTVNLASRMEGLAEPGATYVSDDVFKLTEGFFRFEALGAKEIKGKEESVNVFRVIAPSTRRTRFDVSAERGLTPFVGRERELELLLDGFERSKASRGQAFSIVAEAGVGKSRLLYEFRKAVSSEDVIFQEGKCLSYSRGVAYHPVIDIVKSNFDIMSGDGDVEIREKLKRGLNILDADEASTLPYLLELLSVKDSGVDPIALSPEARKDRIIRAINRITIKASQIRPLIVATEDLHWIDSSSEDYFKELLESIAGSRVFLIFTYRPEFVHTWGAKSYHSQLNLNRLSNRESLAMVTHLLGTEDIGNDLEELILEKTEGVPFFIEEFIKSLKDLNAIERKNGIYHLAKDIQAVSIPSTIQDVIMARVDKLPEGAKNLLQTGSVIEREFSYKLIKTVSGLSEQDLLTQLSVLKDSELIFERGIYPESTYVFKHALTQEVVYDSILTRKKKELHNKIGQSIEQIYKDNLQEHYGVLAEHFINGENFENGSNYCRLAARKAEKPGSLVDAITYKEKQIECLERLPKTEGLEKNIIDARTVLGLFYAQMGHFIKAKAICDPIIKLAESSDYKRRISYIYCILGVYSIAVTEDISKALEHYKKALKIGSELNDPLALVLTNNFMGGCLTGTCEFDKALYHLTKALEINVSANAQWGISAIKSWIARNYFYQGNIDLAHKNSLEALKIAKESGDIFSMAHAYTLHGLSCYGKGNLEEAKEHTLKGIDLSEKIKLPYIACLANNYLAEIYFAMRDYEASQKHRQRTIAILRDNDFQLSLINSCKLALLRANLMMNTNIDRESMYALYNEIKFQVWKSDAQMYIGEILLALDDSFLSEAEDWVKKAIEFDKRNGMMFYLGRDYVLHSELFKRKEDLPKAKENLAKAIEIFNGCGADGWVEKYEKELNTYF